MSHAIAHVPRRSTVAPLNPDTVARWRDTGRLTAADVLAILADRDPSDPHPVGTYVARLRKVTQ